MILLQIFWKQILLYYQVATYTIVWQCQTVCQF